MGGFKIASWTLYVSCWETRVFAELCLSGTHSVFSAQESGPYLQGQLISEPSDVG